jgi:hypothetical protein
VLTKDLAVPWFADFLHSGETFWPTSRPTMVQNKRGVPYPGLSRRRHVKNLASFKQYWTKLGFIRRQPGDRLAEEEALLPRP